MSSDKTQKTSQNNLKKGHPEEHACNPVTDNISARSSNIMIELEPEEIKIEVPLDSSCSSEADPLMLKPEIKLEDDYEDAVEVAGEGMYLHHQIKEEVIYSPTEIQKTRAGVRDGTNAAADLPSGTSVSRRRRRRIVDPAAGPPGQPAPLTSPPRKRKPSVISIGEKEIIINVFKYVRRTDTEYPSTPNNIKTVSEMTGFPKQSIYRILGEYRDTHTVTEQDRHRRCIVNKLDDLQKCAIRNIVYSFYLSGELPTVPNIKEVIDSDETLPKFSSSTLRVILEKLKFEYVKRRALVDSPEIVTWRKKYLKKMKAFREEKRRIFYTDEMWLYPDIFKEGSSAENPLKGKRLILVHIGNENGFLKRCSWVFDYQKPGPEENLEPLYFENWFSKVLNKLQPGDVVVLDNASCHSRDCVFFTRGAAAHLSDKPLVAFYDTHGQIWDGAILLCRQHTANSGEADKTPTIKWSKENIQNWLRSKNIEFENDEMKSQLLEKVKDITQNKRSYVIDDMALEKGITVLRIPPYHDLNPIVHMWADLKGYMAENNDKFKVDVNKSLQDYINQIPKQKWAEYVAQAEKEEVKLRGLDSMIDKTVDKFIHNVSNSFDNDSSSSDDNSRNIVLCGSSSSE